MITLSLAVAAPAAVTGLIYDSDFRQKARANWRSVLHCQPFCDSLRTYCLLCGQWVQMKGPVKLCLAAAHLHSELPPRVRLAGCNTRTHVLISSIAMQCFKLPWVASLFVHRTPMAEDRASTARKELETVFGSGLGNNPMKAEEPETSEKALGSQSAGKQK